MDTRTLIFLVFTPPQFESPLYHLNSPEPLKTPIVNMLDLADFVTERGGDLKKIKESQQKRFAPEETVDEVVALYEEARRGMDSFLLGLARSY